jgi:arginyl-tRNA synthetase
VKRYLLPLLRVALRAIDAPEETEIVLEAPRNPEHGDIATPVALALARQFDLPPAQIAAEIVSSLPIDREYIADVSVEQPGFINFRMTPRFFQKQLESSAAGSARYGRSNVGEGLRVNVEYVSASPVGPLQGGQERNAVIGDIVATLLDWCGYDVTREYYFSNAGREMYRLAKSIHARYMQALGHTVEFPNGGFDQDYIAEIAAEIVRSYGAAFIDPTEGTLQAIQDIGERWSFARIKQTLAALSIEHDIYYNENSLYKNGLINVTLRDLERAGVTYERDGAIWLRLDQLRLGDRMLVRKDGEPTHRLAEIAYHRDKYRRGFQLIVDVFAADELPLLADMKGGLAALDYDPDRIRIVPTDDVRLVPPENGLPLPKIDALTAELGPDIIRFFFAMRGTASPLDFDVELAREHSERNPLYFIQYAHARVAGVLRHAALEGYAIEPAASLAPLSLPEELALIRAVLEFPNMVQRAARELEPRIITDYLRDLAAAFNSFHHYCRVVTEGPDLRGARLRLLGMVRMTLENGLRVLGVSAPERV